MLWTAGAAVRRTLTTALPYNVSAVNGTMVVPPKTFSASRLQNKGADPLLHCFYSFTENPWLQVDLGGVRDVYGIALTSRGCPASVCMLVQYSMGARTPACTCGWRMHFIACTPSLV